MARSTDLKAAASAGPTGASTLAAAAPLLLLILVDAIGFAMLTPLLASALADGSDEGIAKGLSPTTREQALASLAALRTKRVHKYLRELDPLGTPARARAGHDDGVGIPGQEAGALASMSGHLLEKQVDEQVPVDDAPTVHLQRAAAPKQTK